MKLGRSKNHFFGDPISTSASWAWIRARKRLFQENHQHLGFERRRCHEYRVPFKELFENFGPPPEKWWTGAADQNLAIPWPPNGVEPQRLILMKA